MLHPRATVLAGVLAAALLAGCAGSQEGADPAPSPSASATQDESGNSSASGSPESPTPKRSTPARAPLGTTPPAWLGTRVLPHEPGGYGEIQRTPPELRNRRFTLPDSVPMLPGRGFVARISDPAPASVIARSTWQPSCPVAKGDLSWIRLTFRGFDGKRHTGELLVNTDVDEQLVEVFRDLWDARFPMEQMVIARASDLEAPPTGDGNGTGAFNCRPIAGGTSFSQHAYGLAVDVNTFQNPYRKDDVVLPELASAYLDRDDVRPGMVTADGPVVQAFADIGWGWGGAWSSLKDYQHFSQNGR